MASQAYACTRNILMFALLIHLTAFSFIHGDGNYFSFPHTLRKEGPAVAAEGLSRYADLLDGVTAAQKDASGCTITESNFADVIGSMSNARGELVFTTFSLFPLPNGTLKDHLRYGMTAFNANFAWHLRAAGVERFLVVGLTEAACEATRTRGIPCFVDGLPWLRHAKVYFGRQVALKWYYLHKMAAVGYHPVFLDNDVVVQQDPFRHWDRDYDFQGLSDARLTARGHMAALAGEASCPVKYGVAFPCMSTGIMLLRSTETVRLFLASFVRRLEQTPSKWEQALFQRAIVPFLMQVGDGPAAVRYRLLPVEQFHNVKDLKKRKMLRLPVNSVMVHCGKIKGSEAKQSALELERLWHHFPEEARADARENVRE
eukprot:jgi/Mesen1/8804/ME000528S08183